MARDEHGGDIIEVILNIRFIQNSCRFKKEPQDSCWWEHQTYWCRNYCKWKYQSKWWWQTNKCINKLELLMMLKKQELKGCWWLPWRYGRYKVIESMWKLKLLNQCEKCRNKFLFLVKLKKHYDESMKQEIKVWRKIQRFPGWFVWLWNI